MATLARWDDNRIRETTAGRIPSSLLSARQEARKLPSAREAAQQAVRREVKAMVSARRRQPRNLNPLQQDGSRAPRASIPPEKKWMPSTDWLPSGPSKLPSKASPLKLRQLHERTDLEVLEAAAAEVRSLVKQLPAVLPAIGSDEANIFRDEARVARRADATTGPTTNTHQHYQSKALSPMREAPPRLFREPLASYREPSGAGELAAMAEGVLARRRALHAAAAEKRMAANMSAQLARGEDPFAR